MLPSRVELPWRPPLKPPWRTKDGTISEEQRPDLSGKGQTWQRYRHQQQQHWDLHHAALEVKVSSGRTLVLPQIGYQRGTKQRSGFEANIDIFTQRRAAGIIYRLAALLPKGVEQGFTRTTSRASLVRPEKSMIPFSLCMNPSLCCLSNTLLPAAGCCNIKPWMSQIQRTWRGYLARAAFWTEGGIGLHAVATRIQRIFRGWRGKVLPGLTLCHFLHVLFETD